LRDEEAMELAVEPGICLWEKLRGFAPSSTWSRESQQRSGAHCETYAIKEERGCESSEGPDQRECIDGRDRSDSKGRALSGSNM
jgi:hypothetical protein